MATDRMLVWSGISRIDNATPIIVLATYVPRIGTKSAGSKNAKTGEMIQTYILNADSSPIESITTGNDQSICGTCPQRGKASGGSGACYVNVGQGPTSTWKAHNRNGSVPFDVERFRGKKVRFGAYGDPAAVPFEVWKSIADVAESVTGYTHQWRTADPRFSQICMASADSVSEALEAKHTHGYRNFIVRPAGSAKPSGAIVCPASAEAGKKITCSDCLMCGGTSSNQTRDITIIAHGTSARMFATA